MEANSHIIEYQNKNKPFQILTGIAILLVVCGHLDLRVLTIGDLFPYYSFHVMIFLFVSGYFYKEKNETNLLQYISRKAKHLLLPYFLWNIFYGILVTILHKMGFGFGSDLSFKSLLIDTFADGHQYMLNFASWFVPALFLVQVVNVLGRKVLRVLADNKVFRNRTAPSASERPDNKRPDNKRTYYKRIDCKEAGILLITLLLGITTVYLAIEGHVWGYWKLPGRILFMLPVYEMGIFYKKILEKYANKIPDGVMLLAVLIIQFIVVRTCNGLAFSAVWCSSFANGPIIPYVTTITGIIFWYRISKMLAKIPKVSHIVAYIGDRSFSVMMHHVLGFFIVNTIFYFAYTSQLASAFANFDVHSYLYSVDYVYWIHDNPFTKWIYLAAGLTISLLLYKVEAAVRNIVKKRQHE